MNKDKTELMYIATLAIYLLLAIYASSYAVCCFGKVPIVHTLLYALLGLGSLCFLLVEKATKWWWKLLISFVD